MTNQEIAYEIMQLSPSDIDEVLEEIYDNVDTEMYTEMLTGVGIDATRWCKKKHPPAG